MALNNPLLSRQKSEYKQAQTTSLGCASLARPAAAEKVACFAGQDRISLLG
jgi:hypothetical protein